MADEKTVDFIKAWEGVRLAAYRDSAGVWTIGYGHTERVQPCDTCTTRQAEEWLAEEVDWFEKGVIGSCKVAPTGNQLTALTSFAYNLGLGSLRKSQLLRKHNIANFRGAAEEFRKWNKARHPETKQLREVPGLTRRREAERLKYLQPEGQ